MICLKSGSRNSNIIIDYGYISMNIKLHNGIKFKSKEIKK